MQWLYYVWEKAVVDREPAEWYEAAWSTRSLCPYHDSHKISLTLNNDRVYEMETGSVSALGLLKRDL